MISIASTGFSELTARLQELEQVKFFSKFMRVVAQSAFDNAETAIKPHSRTGVLEKSLGGGPIPIGGDDYEIKSDASIAPYSPFVHWGTRPHDIYPKNRKALRWVAGNAFVFAKFIRHPGYKGDPFMLTAEAQTLRDFDRLVQEHLSKI